jgi:nitroimidazol reductase NimA-like FMN-containing flavoprotein (pyridoxamine 5'-phosphate oxidase superfamily)
MRRKDKEILQPALIQRIIGEAQVCRLGLCKDNIPYIVPVSFGYDGTALYFHTAVDGRKIEFFRANNQVCFEIEHEVAIIPNEERACGWSFSFYSIIGYGVVEELVEDADRERGLQLVMEHYSGRGDWEFQDQHLQHVRVWRIRIEQVSGKQSKDKASASSAS